MLTILERVDPKTLGVEELPSRGRNVLLCNSRLSSAVAALLGAVVLAAPVHADSDGTDFLNAPHKQGISSSAGDQELMKLGHMICNLLGDGYSQDALIDMGELHGTKMSDDDVKVLVKSAEAAYCPEYIQ